MIYNEDCIETMKRMEDNSIDAIVTDPPYGLQFMNKEWDKLWRNSTEKDKEYIERTKNQGDGLTSRARSLPDYSAIKNKEMQDWHYQWAKEAFRVLKPGGHLLAFGGSRTYHRMACAIEDAGFEIRDQIMWVYGSGFPKSLDVGKAVDKLQGNERESLGITQGVGNNNTESMNSGVRKSSEFNHEYELTKGTSEWEGWGTALKPSHESIVVARKPLEGTVAENVLKWGTGGMNIDGCRIEHNEEQKFTNRKERSAGWNMDNCGFDSEENHTASANKKGRFPANFIHDGSEEVVGLFPYTKTGKMNSICNNTIMANKPGIRDGKPIHLIQDANEGSAARFFYCAKASRSERNKGCEELEKKVKDIEYRQPTGNAMVDRIHGCGKPSTNHHPTVKPIALMRYLIRLVTPPKGTVYDPFCGSGTTLIAAKLEKVNFLGSEIDPEYVKIAEKRLAFYKSDAQLEIDYLD